MLESLPEKTRGFLAVMGWPMSSRWRWPGLSPPCPTRRRCCGPSPSKTPLSPACRMGVSFRFHHMMKECAERLFAQLPAARQTEVWQRYGHWYAKKPSTSTRCRPLSTVATTMQPLAVIEADAGECLPPSAPPSCCSGWTAAGGSAAAPPAGHSGADAPDVHRQQIPKMMELKALLEAAVAPTPAWPAAEAGNLLGGVRPHPELLVLQRHHPDEPPPPQRQPPDEPPAVTPAQQRQLDLRLPSVLMMYYRAPGELGKELTEMYECMPHYYKITNGHGRGPSF